MKELLKELIEAESTPAKGELAAAEVISAEFRRSGIDSRVDVWDSVRANVVAHVKSTGARPALLFACHLDVVGPGEAAWKHPPFSALEKDGKIYGRGSVDMKGGTAATVAAIRRIVDSGAKLQGDLIFLACAGEETDSCGAIRFASDSGELPRLAGVIVPEPTDFTVVTAHRGMLWLEITTRGKAAHSSTPQLGVNAINSMRLILNELDSYEVPVEPHELLGKCSMSINTITGGKTLNVVPDKCSIMVDIRTLPRQNNQDVVADFERIFAGLKSRNPQFDAEVSVLREMGALETDSGCDFVKDFCSCVGVDETVAVGFTTDAPHLVSLGGPPVIFGPGKTHLCHKPDEWIDITDLERAADLYEKTILKFLT
jgi:succinyl-diaminopimelate desuccinylase